MDSKLQFQAFEHMDDAVENRLGYGAHRIKTPLGMRFKDLSLDGIQQVAAQLQQVLTSLPDVRSIFAERVSQGFYIMSKSIGRKQLVMDSPSRTFSKSSLRE